jgi:hypothetical protein
VPAHFARGTFLQHSKDYLSFRGWSFAKPINYQNQRAYL